MLRPTLGALGRAAMAHDAPLKRDKDGRFASGGGSTAATKSEHVEAATEHYKAMNHHATQYQTLPPGPGPKGAPGERHLKAHNMHKEAYEVHNRLASFLPGAQASRGELNHAHTRSKMAYHASGQTSNSGGAKPTPAKEPGMNWFTGMSKA